MTTGRDQTVVQRKLALIIGNGGYTRRANRLKHAVDNAEDLRDLLQEHGFATKLYCDISKDMMVKIAKFTKRIRENDLVLFYYSGHCVRVKGKNYLIPVDDTSMEKDEDLGDIGADLGIVLNRLTEKNPDNVSLFFLDCYKPYSLKDEPMSVSMSKRPKLAKTPRGAFVQFACAADQKESVVPSVDRNDLFTKHLMKNIVKENITIADLFQRIANGVYRESNEKQKPLAVKGSHKVAQTTLNVVPYDEAINHYGDRIRDLQVELERLTLRTSTCANGPSDPVRAHQVRALIHKLTLRRNQTITRCYSAAPMA